MYISLPTKNLGLCALNLYICNKKKDQISLKMSARWSGQWGSRAPKDPRGSRCRLSGFQVIKEEPFYRVPGGKGAGLQGPRGSRGRPAGSQGVKWHLWDPIAPSGMFDETSDDS